MDNFAGVYCFISVCLTGAFGACPSGDRVFNNGGFCYVAHDYSVTWYEAGEACRTAGGELLTNLRYQRDVQKMVHLAITANLLSEQCHWIGATAEQSEGKLEWTDGTTVPSTLVRADFMEILLARWFSTCGQICYRNVHSFQQSYLQMRGCSQSEFFICQHEHPETTVSTTARPSKQQPTRGVQRTVHPETTVSSTAGPSKQQPTRGIQRTASTQVSSTSTGPSILGARDMRRLTHMLMMVKVESDIYILPKPLWRRKAFVVTMCMRLCRDDPTCRVANYGIESKTCRGYKSVENKPTEAKEKWDLWTKKIIATKLN